jgi:hypothetical protein
MPAYEAAYHKLVLNQRVEASSHSAMPAQWQAYFGAPLKPPLVTTRIMVTFKGEAWMEGDK